MTIYDPVAGLRLLIQDVVPERERRARQSAYDDLDAIEADRTADRDELVRLRARVAELETVLRGEHGLGVRYAAAEYALHEDDVRGVLRTVGRAAGVEGT